MAQPTAVDPSNPKPGLYITVDLLRGTTSPGTSGLRYALLSPPATGVGDITIGTEIRPVFSKEDVETGIGRGLGYLAYQALIANDPQALVDLIGVAESGGAAAAQTLTFSGTPTDRNTFDVYISGIKHQVEWNAGESVTTAKTNSLVPLNAHSSDVFAVASAGAAGVANITARSKGPAGNDITLRVVKTAGTGGVLTAGGANLAGGTTEIDITTALSTIAGREYDYILPCISNADAQAASSNNPARLSTHIDLYKQGSNAKLQQGIYGSTGTISAAKVNTVARNHTNLEHCLMLNAEDLPCEIMAAEAGDRGRRRRREINANRVLQPLKRLRGAADKTTYNPSDTQAIDALSNGVTLFGYTANNEPMLLRSITTHSLDTLGNADKRCFDTNEVDALYDYGKDLRAFLPQQFMAPDGQVKIAKNRVAGDEDLPERVVEERDVKAAIVNRTLGFWIPKGVIDGDSFRAAVDDGTLTVQVNASDPNQCDVFIPAKAFKILAKIGVYLAKVG